MTSTGTLGVSSVRKMFLIHQLILFWVTTYCFTLRHWLHALVSAKYEFTLHLCLILDRLETANKQRAAMEDQDHSQHAIAKLAEQST